MFRAKSERNLIDVEQRVPTDEQIAPIFLHFAAAEFFTIPAMTEASQIADFPDWRSPMTSSRCPRQTGKSTSITRIPIATAGLFLERTKIDGLGESITQILEKYRYHFLLQVLLSILK